MTIPTTTLAVASATPGATGFDADAPLGSATLSACTAQGCTFCVRWVPPSQAGPSGPADLTPGEAQEILGAGLALMVAQSAQVDDGSTLDAALGTTNGTNAGLYAQAVGIQPGTNVWMELRDVLSPAADVIQYCTSWYTQVQTAGFVPGLCVGANAGLSGAQLYDLPFQNYWGAADAAVSIPTRGWCLQQSATAVPGGYPRDTAQTDDEGGQAQWLVATSTGTVTYGVQGPPTPPPGEPWMHGFDADQPISGAMARQLAGDYGFCVRYVGRVSMDLGDLTAAEAQAILGAGLGLMVVQHVEAGQWMPSGELGTTYGANAAGFAKAIGILPGVNVWLDLESVSLEAGSADVIAYCQNWYQQVEAAGYVPGIYVGWQPQLTGEQLYDLSFQHYWGAYNVDGSNVPPCGWCLEQFSAHGGGVGGVVPGDVDVAQPDNLGRTVKWMALTI